MGSILNGCRVMGVFCHKGPPVNRASPFALLDLEPAGTQKFSDSCIS